MKAIYQAAILHAATIRLLMPDKTNTQTEVETVRRGLEPVMEGAKFSAVIRPSRRTAWTRPRTSRRGSRGPTVTGLAAGRNPLRPTCRRRFPPVAGGILGMSGSLGSIETKGQDARRPYLS